MRFSIVIFSLLLFSCNKVKEKKLVGEWTVTRVEIKDGSGFMYYDTIFDEASSKVLFTNDSIKANLPFEFVALGSSSIVLDSFVLKSPWNLNKDLIELPGDNYSLKIELLVKDKLIFNLYDFQNYRLKTFYMQKQ